MAISETLSTPLTEGAQYDHIEEKNINLLFRALEEIRNKFEPSMTGTYASQSFNTKPVSQEEIITNQYISKIKEYIQAIETSSYVPDTYSNKIVIPSADTYIEVGEYYNKYITILQDIYKNCMHNGSYGAGAGSGCAMNWSFSAKCYDVEYIIVDENGNQCNAAQRYNSVCGSYQAVSHSAQYSMDYSGYCPQNYGGNYSNNPSSGGCPSNCTGFAGANYRWV